LKALAEAAAFQKAPAISPLDFFDLIMGPRPGRDSSESTGVGGTDTVSLTGEGATTGEGAVTGEGAFATSTGAGGGLGGSLLILLGGRIGEALGTAGRAVAGGAVGGASCSMGVLGLLYATGAKGAGVSEDATDTADGDRGMFAVACGGASTSWVLLFKEEDLAG
jgi:hypothetical protein